MKKMSMSALLSAAWVLVAPFARKAAPTMTLIAPTIDLDALRAARPRSVAAMPAAKASTPEEILAEINTSFETFKAKHDESLNAKVDDTVLTEHVDRINATITELTKSYEAQAATIAALRLGGGAGGVSPEAAEHAEVFNTWFRKGDRAIDADVRELEVKAGLTTQSDPDGGYLVPEEMEKGIDRVLGTVSAMRGLSRVVSIGTDTYKKLVGVGGATSGWVSEEQARPETETPKLREIALTTAELYANPAATQTLLDDAMVDIAAWLAGEVAIEFAEQEGAAFIRGSGVGKPRGILAYDTVANASYAWGKIGFVKSGGAAGFASADPADALIDLYYGLKQGYRNGAVFLTSDPVMGTMRKWKDGDGNYLWSPPSGSATVGTILGKPVHTDDNMDKLEAGKFPVAFADFQRAYTVLDRIGTRVLRDPYTNKPFVHFYTTKRVGGGITNFEALKLLKCAA
ncbi:HK97 family phage major capsid protein [Hephaestia caeni]|uniref:HK97 family phage major capsid protein n=1 Tax=Hephaestia caeni TaxID=645617 RepID=A0A397NIX5_9SPHN|nr:phage major capsid protein [Hephaestia caeni]RIA37482.1 HK97 family phage major capsid protein [Hephaestia caeni]